MNQNDIAYIAGLFDGEGSVMCKQYMRKKKGEKKAYKTWNIRCEIAMTEKEVIEWLHETLGFGWSKEKTGKRPKHYKRQWRWQCSHRDALTFAKLVWPYTQIKLHQIERIIDHYEPYLQGLDDNVVELDTYRK